MTEYEAFQEFLRYIKSSVYFFSNNPIEYRVETDIDECSIIVTKSLIKITIKCDNTSFAIFIYLSVDDDGIDITDYYIEVDLSIFKEILINDIMQIRLINPSIMRDLDHLSKPINLIYNKREEILISLENIMRIDRNDRT